MESIGAYEAKTHLARLIERAAGGERITITKHGAPVAILSPARAAALPVADIILELKRFRAANRTGGLEIREMMEEGRL